MRLLEKISANTTVNLQRQYCCFDTAIGKMAVAWSENGIVGLSLPEQNDVALRRRMSSLGAVEGEPDSRTRQVISRIEKHLSSKKGFNDDYLDVQLDYEGVTSFRHSVFEASRHIGPGQTISYGELAQMIGSRAKCRAVGQALGANRHPIIIPCHRIVGKGGALVGFSAEGGCDLKLRLLRIEGAV